jgi:UDP-glucose 4-epimerase
MPLCLVTGGAGFIGSNLVRALASAGERVRVLDDLSFGTWDNLGELRGARGVECIEGDIRDHALVARAVQGVQVVFHQAALGSVPLSIDDPERADSINVGGTVTVLRAAEQAGVRRVLLATSAAAYGDEPTLPKVETMPSAPLSPYAVSKITCEMYARVFAGLYPLDTVSLRYFNVFGPGQRPDGAYAAAIPRFLWEALHERAPTVFGDGAQTRDFCFVDNVVQANLKAASSPAQLGGQVINIATGTGVSLSDVIDEIGRVLGRRVAAEHAPPRAGDIRHSVADIQLARELLGYAPEIAWRDGLPQTAQFLRSLAKQRGAA